jgi:hypothetical protein
VWATVNGSARASVLTDVSFLDLQGGPEAASVGDKMKGMAKGAYYFFASGAGGGKIDGLKPRDSGVRLVLISYSDEEACFKGLLCHALVPGGHADTVSAVCVSPTCEVVSTVSPQKGCMWSVAFKAMTASHASGEEVRSTKKNPSPTRNLQPQSRIHCSKPQ